MLPVVLASDLDLWEEVIQAARMLEMPDLHRYVLSKLGEQKSSIKPNAVRFLNWATQYEAKSYKTLIFECFRILAYRRLPISQTNADTLGARITIQVMTARERVRSLFLVPESLEQYIIVHEFCPHRKTSSCRHIVIRAIVKNLMEVPSRSAAELDIFENLSSNNMCDFCGPTVMASIETLKKEKLDPEIWKCTGISGTMPEQT
ncbi:hypothetical protein CTheo_5972 [Ceratobasidium theobromae]|uniref:Uncharacterized protein n=1 Tax=Ceratobasidium theobromae TaxID=1582974 RepID=A0A5N5QH13_9AGAM|nr:hypothetical protein CTheo_5972 [Ceratobasidium theobromae]